MKISKVKSNKKTTSSSVTDKIFEIQLKKTVKFVGRSATKKAFKLNLPVTGGIDNDIIQLHPDNTKRIIGKIKKVRAIKTIRKTVKLK